ncbi:MAG: DEAD/DEAH box helicase [Bacteroidetes bacterium]|nr:DEAD/DEAH box helicase [Bacteroidota bacterium]
MITFDQLNLSKQLLNALSELGYIYPTPIQEKSFPVIMSGKNVIGVAQTGTGKTFAYLLPILRQLKYSEERQPRILIVVPTRELVLQIVKEIEKLSKYVSVRFAGVYGGTNINTQKTVVYNGLDILVGTPGRLMDLALTGILRWKSIQTLVIDEVDEMFNLGFRTQLVNLIDALPKKRQTLLFSATMSDDVKKIISEFVIAPVTVAIANYSTPVEKIEQTAYYVPNFHTKVNLLEHLLKNHPELNRVLVFVKSKRLADNLYTEISNKFPNQLGVIHSNKTQPQRFGAIQQFGSGELRVLIATDIIARGLDIENITHVINFDTPDIATDYIHRIGRTGRADKTGASITFISEAEKEFQVQIETYMNKEIPIVELPKDVKISTKYTEDEKPVLFDKGYYKSSTIKKSKGAFHEKKGKNMKINLGGPYKRRMALEKKQGRKRK